MKERKYTRLPYQSEVELYFDQKRYQTLSQDLSLRGIKVLAPRGLSVSPETQVTLNLYDDGLLTEIDGRIAFQQDGYWGIVFTQIGEYSLKNLMKLLEKNTNDKKQINREAQKMVLKVCSS